MIELFGEKKPKSFLEVFLTQSEDVPIIFKFFVFIWKAMKKIPIIMHENRSAAGY